VELLQADGDFDVALPLCDQELPASTIPISRRLVPSLGQTERPRGCRSAYRAQKLGPNFARSRVNLTPEASILFQPVVSTCRTVDACPLTLEGARSYQRIGACSNPLPESGERVLRVGLRERDHPRRKTPERGLPTQRLLVAAECRLLPRPVVSFHRSPYTRQHGTYSARDGHHSSARRRSQKGAVPGPPPAANVEVQLGSATASAEGYCASLERPSKGLRLGSDNVQRESHPPQERINCLGSEQSASRIPKTWIRKNPKVNSISPYGVAPPLIVACHP
jgi:hypothetical protein